MECELWRNVIDRVGCRSPAQPRTICRRPRAGRAAAFPRGTWGPAPVEPASRGQWLPFHWSAKPLGQRVDLGNQACRDLVTELRQILLRFGQLRFEGVGINLHQFFILVLRQIEPVQV